MMAPGLAVASRPRGNGFKAKRGEPGREIVFESAPLVGGFKAKLIAEPLKRGQ